MDGISTAARRVVRAVNARRAGFVVYFDRDGRVVDETFGPEAFGPRRDSYHLAVSTVSHGRRWRPTQRDIQDRLDALADAERAGRPDLAEDLLHARQAARRSSGSERRTRSLAEEISDLDAANAAMQAEWEAEYAAAAAAEAQR